MDIRLTLKDGDEKLAQAVATAQSTSNRDAVLNVFRKHGKQYSRKRLAGFSTTKAGRPKKGTKS